MNKSVAVFISYTEKVFYKSFIERMVLMSGNKNKGLVKVIGVGLTAAVLSFTLTGVAENAVSGAISGKTFSDGLKQLTNLSAILTIPINDFDGNYSSDTSAESTADDTDRQPSVPVSDTKEASSEEEQPSSNTESVSDESLVPVDAPVQNNTRLISLNIRKEKDDLTSYTAKDGVTKEKHYGKITGDNVIDLENGQIRNCTNMPANIIASEGTKKPEIKLDNGNEPQVLIIHTHTTESYESDSDGHYDKAYDGRSLCPANSVVGVGAVLAQTLADNGISTIHDGTVFDDPIYNYSYSRSRERIEEILAEYPSIKIVLDIHRDGIADGDVRIAPVAEINGKKAAQIMIICGCDDGTGILPDFMSNLRFASYLQNSIERDNSGITRPLLFDYRFYNQDLTKGSLVIEFGALANDIEHVKYSAELAGKSIAQALKELQ